MITTAALSTFSVVASVKERFARFLRAAITDWERSQNKELRAEDWRKIGLTADRVTNWRMGENLPSAENLVILSRFFSWDGNELMHVLGVPRPKGEKAIHGLVDSRPKLAELIVAIDGLPDSRIEDLIRIAGSLRAHEAV